MKRLVLFALIASIALLVAGIATFFLMPMWSWFERVSGIESVGHSGPATWCFLVTYLAILAIAVAISRATRKRSGDGPGQH